MSKTLRYSLTLLLCLILFACLLPAAYADGLSDLKAAIDEHNVKLQQNPAAQTDFYTTGDFTINEELEIPSGFLLVVNNALTIGGDGVVTVFGIVAVDEAGTVTVNESGTLDAAGEGLIENYGKITNYGYLRMFDAGRIKVYGELENKYKIYFREGLTEEPHLYIEEGSTVITYNAFFIHRSLDPDTVLSGVSIDDWCLSIERKNPAYLVCCPGNEFSHFEGVCSGVNYLFVQNVESITISENMEIPSDAQVYAPQTAFTLAKNKTMTVAGDFELGKLTVNSGASVVLEDDGWLCVDEQLSISGSMTLYDILHIDAPVWNALTTATLNRITYQKGGSIDVHHYAETEAALRTAVSTGASYNNVHVNAIVEVTKSVALTANLDIPERVHVTAWEGFSIPAGKKLTVGGVFEGRHIPITVRGEIVNNGDIYLRDRVDETSPLLSFLDNGNYSGSGRIIVSNVTDRDTADSYFSGLTLTDFISGVSGKDRIYASSERVQDYTPFITAYNNKPGNKKVLDAGEYVVSTNFEIPAGVEVTAENSSISVPSGVTLTIKGQLNTTAFAILNGGKVIVDGGKLNVIDSNPIAFIVDGTLTLNNGEVDAKANFWVDENYGWDDVTKSHITFSGNSPRLNIFFTASKGNAEPMIAMAARVNDAYVYPICQVRYVFTPENDITIAGNTVLETFGDFTVPYGKSLKVEGVFKPMATVTVAGMLLNHNEIILGENANVVMLQKSIYSGLGTVTRNGQPYSIWNSKDSADLILPEDLTSIESEAFANGRYGSAYIPEGVTFIAPDAFGDKEHMTIYGVPRTKALEFAIDKGFLFAPVEPSAPAA